MQILLANAKIMNDCSEVQPLTTPMFQTVANELAAEMALCDIDTLAKNLDAVAHLQQKTGADTRTSIWQRNFRQSWLTMVRPTSI